MWPAARQEAPSREYGRADPGGWAHGCADQAPAARRELRYGSREFLAASDLARRLPHSPRHPSASWARYQLHTFLALDLGCSGARHLLAGSALRETAGNQYFQHLLGYRARNLRFEVAESGAP